MAESRDTHVIEIPKNPQPTVFDAMHHHPLTEISQSPGHLLLLKLWHRKEDLIGRRIAAHETRLDNIKRESFQLCSLFFAFHGLFLTLLFTASMPDDHRGGACKNWWVPSALSLLTSLVLISSVQVKILAYWKISRQLSRERDEGRALARCMQELRMKGTSFDLSKEPQTAKRMKSSSVEVKWRLIRWWSNNLVTICLICFTGMVFPVSKLILCN